MNPLLMSIVVAHLTESKSSVDESDAEFRSRVEKIRQIGGDAWLTLYDEVHSEEEMTQVCAHCRLIR